MDEITILIKLNQETQQLFEEVIEKKGIDSMSNKLAEHAGNGFKDPIEVVDLFWLKDNLPEGKHFYEIVEACDILLPKPKIEPRNPELEARIQRLKREQEERQYKDMTKNVDSTRIRCPEESFAHHVKEMDKQLISIASILVSIAAAFVFGFLGLQLIAGPIDMTTRILLGIISMIIVSVAELYFFIKKLEDSSWDKHAKKND